MQMGLAYKHSYMVPAKCAECLVLFEALINLCVEIHIQINIGNFKARLKALFSSSFAIPHKVTALQVLSY